MRFQSSLRPWSPSMGLASRAVDLRAAVKDVVYPLTRARDHDGWCRDCWRQVDFLGCRFGQGMAEQACGLSCFGDVATGFFSEGGFAGKRVRFWLLARISQPLLWCCDWTSRARRKAMIAAVRLMRIAANLTESASPRKRFRRLRRQWRREVMQHFRNGAAFGSLSKAAEYHRVRAGRNFAMMRGRGKAAAG